MEEIIISDDKKLKGKVIGSGMFSECYLYDTNVVVKIFKNGMKNQYGELDESKLRKFINIQNDSYCFPNGLVYINNQLKGYSMPLVRGVSLSKIPDDVNFNFLIDNYKKLYDDTISITNLGVLLSEDMNDDNIILTENGYTILDIDPFEIYDKNIYKVLPIDNVTQINEAIFFALCNNDDNIIRILNREFKCDDYNKFRASTLEDMSNLLNEYKKFMEGYFQMPITTIGDIRKISDKFFEPPKNMMGGYRLC